MLFVLAQIDATLLLTWFFLAQGIPGLIGPSSQCGILMLHSPVVFMFLTLVSSALFETMFGSISLELAN